LSEFPVVRKMNTGRRTLRILGLPIQFVVVMVVSAALVIYLGAAAADSNVHARAEAFGAPIIRSSDSVSQHQLPTGADAESWEGAFLWVCPLH
jgi:hypothetical protein